jgi:hypothetical protein
MNRVSLMASAIIFSMASVCRAVSYDAADCSYDEVNALVSSESLADGDSINVPACPETIWNDPLVITKAITLQGAGIDSTNITGNLSSVTGIIQYHPADPDSDHRFRVTGFTFDNSGLSNIMHLSQNTTTPEYVRIDHNKFIMSTTGRGIYIVGTIFGVADNNIFESDAGVISFYGNDSVQWNGVPRNFGDENNFYFEDNTVNKTSDGISGSGQGGRYVHRYNTVQTLSTTSMTEFHGNQPGGSYDGGGNASTMMVEIYGNDWISGSAIGNVIDQRGGQALIYMNNLTVPGMSWMYAREEYTDDQWPENSGWVQHVTDSYQWANWETGNILLVTSVNTEENCCMDTSPWQANHFYGSSDIYCQKFTGDPNGNCWKRSNNPTASSSPYYSHATTEPDWASVPVRGQILDGDIYWLNMGPNDTPLALNVDLWVQSSTGIFDGTGSESSGGGVGCGTLAERPATCTTGVGYWATNQSCTDLSGMVGRNPSTPISGTLYKCTAPDTWTAYYTPYDYPHPLRAGDAVAPAAPTGLTVL